MTLSTLLMMATAWANGMYAPDQDFGTGTLLTADFRAIYVMGEHSTTAVIQSSYIGHRPRFAWVLPVPAPLERDKVGIVTADAVSNLIWSTDPQYHWSQHWGCASMGMYGCSAQGDNRHGNANVNVLDTFYVGPYEVMYLDGDESADITGFLQQAGYHIPDGAEDLFDLYLSEGWTFLVTRLDEAPEAIDQGHALPALAFTYASTTPVYPIRISRETSQEEVETVIITVGPHRMQPRDDEWIAPAIGPYLMGEDFTEWYNTRTKMALEQIDETAWLLEFAGAWEDTLDRASADTWYGMAYDTSSNAWTGGSGQDLVDELVQYDLVSHDDADNIHFVTRYRTWLSPDQMTHDLALELAPNDDTYIIDMESGVVGTEVGSSSFPFIPLAWLGLGAGWGLARRRRHDDA